MIKDRPVPNFIAKIMYKNHSLKRLGKEITLLRSGLIKPGDNVLDIGCGSGHLSLEMARITGKDGLVFALDIHPLAIKSIEKGMKDFGIDNIKTILTKELKTGLSDNYLDSIFMFNSYDMIINKKILHEEIVRVLKPGGKLIICNRKLLLTKDKKYKKIFLKYENMTFDYQEDKVYYYKKR